MEYQLPGINQVQVRPLAGLTFPVALRAILRQDPDVVMVGEIRDRETAEIAMGAAVTGHLVLSTIHATDAPGAITRLLHMGVPPHLVAGGLSAVVAQRLVRTFCRFCRGRNPEACTRCTDGYSGRTGVFQVLAMNDAIRDQIMRGASTSDLGRLASESGMASLTEDVSRKVAEGLTSPHEAARVIQSDVGSVIPCPDCGGEVPWDAMGCPHCGASGAAPMYVWSRREKEVEILCRLPATRGGLAAYREISLRLDGRPGRLIQCKNARQGYASAEASKLPDEIPCSNGTDEHGPVRQQDDQLVQVLDLQRVVQCEAKAVRPVEQQQRARDENRHARKWVAEHREHVRMTGGREPAEREREAEQQQQDRDHQGGHHASGAEENPQERLER